VAGNIPRWFTCPQTVTHPCINPAWRRVTSLITTNALPLSQTTNPVGPYGRYKSGRILILLGRPEPPFRTGLYSAADVFFVSPRMLRATSTDRPETLPDGRNLTEFYTRYKYKSVVLEEAIPTTQNFKIRIRYDSRTHRFTCSCAIR